MTGSGPHPVWVPSDHGPLAGWWHTPVGRRARGAVVLCPPLGREHISSHRTMRLLAERLSASGLAALRFDYAGTGDSADRSNAHDTGDEGTVAAWQQGVRAAASWARRQGAPRLALVGMRMGAILAGLDAADHGEADAVVLWDPCLSGRHFLREQRALRLVNLPGHAPREEGVEAPGFVYGPHTVKELGVLDVRERVDELPVRTLLLTRADEGREAFQRSTGPELDWLPADEQSRLLDLSSVLATEPIRALDGISAWLDRALDGAPAGLAELAPAAPAIVSAHDPARELPVVTEQPLRIGAAGLFGMRTTAPLRSDPNLPCVVFLNVAEEPHIGPGRLWVDLARSLALRGFDVVRMDFNGIGDSPARPGRLQFPTAPLPVMTDKRLLPDDEVEAERLFPNPSYDQGNLDDITDVVDAIDRPVVLVGLCSGAYHAIEMGAALGVAGVCALNPILDFTPPEVRAGLPMDPRRRAVSPRKEWANTVKDRPWADRARAAMPEAGWRMIDRLGLQPSPANGLRLLAEGDMVSLVVCSSHDAAPFLERGAGVLRRLMAAERFTFTVIPELDHALLVWAQRVRISRLLQEHLITTFVDGKATSPSLWSGSNRRAKRRSNVRVGGSTT